MNNCTNRDFFPVQTQYPVSSAASRLLTRNIVKTIVFLLIIWVSPVAKTHAGVLQMQTNTSEDATPVDDAGMPINGCIGLLVTAGTVYVYGKVRRFNKELDKKNHKYVRNSM